MKQNILVVGATGTVGSEIVKGLKDLGHSVRSVTSKQSGLSADQIHVNLLTGEGLQNAFDGIDRAFFLSPAGYTDQEAILIPLIQEAKKRNLKKVVLMSAMGANASDAFPLRKAEIALETSGLTYNIIRPNWFMQNFYTYWIQDIQEKGKILLPAGEAKTSFIDSRDISAVAVQLLTDDQFKNQDFDLTGPESIDHGQVAKVLSEVTGKKITYQEITPEEFKANRIHQGVSAEYSDILNMILSFLKQGYAERVTDSVQKITGRKPGSFVQFAQDNKKRWS